MDRESINNHSKYVQNMSIQFLEATYSR